MERTEQLKQMLKDQTPEKPPEPGLLKDSNALTLAEFPQVPEFPQFPSVPTEGTRHLSFDGSDIPSPELKPVGESVDLIFPDVPKEVSQTPVNVDVYPDLEERKMRLERRKQKLAERKSLLEKKKAELLQRRLEIENME